MNDRLSVSRGFHRKKSREAEHIKGAGHTIKEDAQDIFTLAVVTISLHGLNNSNDVTEKVILFSDPFTVIYLIRQ